MLSSEVGAISTLPLGGGGCLEEQQQGSFSQMDTCLFWDDSLSLSGIRTTTENRLFCFGGLSSADTLAFNPVILRHFQLTLALFGLLPGAC